MRLFRTLAFTAFALVLSGPATLLAETITYNLTLTPTDSASPYTGTGSITFEGAPSASGISDYSVSNGKLDDVVFNIGGQTFTLAGATGNTLVRFLNGQLNDITFAETIGTTPNRFTFNSTANYVFYYNNGQSASYGTFSASPAAPPAVPEPGSLVLLTTGLLGGGGELLRRLRANRLN